jgi:hypothetical protein
MSECSNKELEVLHSSMESQSQSSNESPSKRVIDKEDGLDSSPAWLYFKKSASGESGKCQVKGCNSSISCKGGTTTGMLEHLKRIHKLNPNDDRAVKCMFSLKLIMLFL